MSGWSSSGGCCSLRNPHCQINLLFCFQPACCHCLFFLSVVLEQPCTELCRRQDSILERTMPFSLVLSNTKADKGLCCGVQMSAWSTARAQFVLVKMWGWGGEVVLEAGRPTVKWCCGGVCWWAFRGKPHCFGTRHSEWLWSVLLFPWNPFLAISCNKVFLTRWVVTGACGSQ